MTDGPKPTLIHAHHKKIWRLHSDTTPQCALCCAVALSAVQVWWIASNGCQRISRHTADKQNVNLCTDIKHYKEYTRIQHHSVLGAVEWQGQLYQVLVGCIKIDISPATSVQLTAQEHSSKYTMVLYLDRVFRLFDVCERVNVPVLQSCR